MNLVEVHQIRRTDKDWDDLDNLCFLAKNLYNATLYAVRQYFFQTKKYLNYNAVNKQFTDEKQADYVALPAKVSKWVQMQVDSDFKSFFALLHKKKSGDYDKDIKIPHYADKVKGRKVLHYPKDALSFKKQGYIKLSKTNIYIKTNLPKEIVRYVKVVPSGYCIKLIIGYEAEEQKLLQKSKRYASIDLGLNNLAAVTSNVMKPFIVNGKPLKSINQYANKKKAKFQSELPKKVYTSNKINRLMLNRENKINDYLHKASFYIVNQLVSNKIDTLVVGCNKEWKQDINIGTVNNQNFVSIPFNRFVNLLEYKCKLNGIELIRQEESYSSKCSFLDDEPIRKHSKYMGKRIKRGLYRSNSGILINADINGSLNILKKYLQKKVAWNSEVKEDCVEACSTPNIKVISF